MNLAEFIQQARDQKGLTKKQLADQSATLVGYIRSIEDGMVQSVPIAILLRIAAALDIIQSDYICFLTRRWPDDVASLRHTADSRRVDRAMALFRSVIGASDTEWGSQTILRTHTHPPGDPSHTDTWEYNPYRRAWLRVDCTSKGPCVSPTTCSDPTLLYTFRGAPCEEPGVDGAK